MKRVTSIRYLGDYLLLGEIARGGMGVVFNARQVSLNRRVAVKLINTGHMASEVERRRFRTEAEAAARLDHSNIVSIYEIGEHEGQAFIAMKLIEGESLQDRLFGETQSEDAATPSPAPASHAKPASLPLPRYGGREAAALMAKLARAIGHAHQRGVLHRDIKPGNILIDADGEPHLTDFGLAKLLERESRQTVSHAILGTPDYMPPEQAAGSARAITPASDIYSLGAVFYTLLTGQPPFHGASTGETIEWVKSREPRPPRSLNPKIPPELEIICLKCLEKDASRRYPTGQALAADLDRWISGKTIEARRPTTFERLGKWTKRNPALAGLAATMAIGGLLGLLAGNWIGQRVDLASTNGSSPGALKWESVSASAIQAEPNHGYRLRASSHISVTLPGSPRKGDVVRLAGVGAGGWRLVQNSNQVILTDKLGTGEPSRHWVRREGDRQWSKIACSADGMRCVAVEFGYRQRGGSVYVSSDAGVTWNPSGPKRLWSSCAVSDDGGLLAAVSAFGRIHISTNFGLSWFATAERRNWTDIACSADGRKLVAVDNGTNASGGLIYTSTDHGLTWLSRARPLNWSFVASSSDGSRLAAAVGEANVKGELAQGFIHTSADGGVTWTPRFTDRPRRWTGLATSSDGQTICASEDNGRAEPGGHVYVSRDGGVTWNTRSPVKIWNRIGMSLDGRLLACVVSEKVDEIPNLAISRDLGASWSVVDAPRFWAGFASSKDGRRWIAIAGYFDPGRGSGIFTSVPTTRPGALGSFLGAAQSEIELQYAGGGQFEVMSAKGSFIADGVAVKGAGGATASQR